jgi:hypothetical protein
MPTWIFCRVFYVVYISLSRLTEFLYRQITSGHYHTLEELPVSQWVKQVSEGIVEYKSKPRTRKSMGKEFIQKMKLFLDANVLVSVLNKEYPLKKSLYYGYY